MYIYDLWFCTVKLPNKVKLDLLREFTKTEEIIEYAYSNNKKIFEEDKEYKVKSSLKSAWNKMELQSLLKKILTQNIKVTNFNDDIYPKSLKNYEDAPSILFYKGNIKKLNEGLSVSIVGSRNCSIYGRNVSSLISKKLALNNINMISGMAKGIDSYAHKSSIENGGYTCAVLGSGIDVVYPKENKNLYDTISDKGCIISEFLPGTKPNTYNFPIRNRIISGLSNLIIVVEANEKSGSLITASLALEQGKDIIAVPGSIFSEQSKGTNKLIRDGAYPFTNFNDLFEILNLKYCENKEEIITRIKGLERKVYDIISDTPIHIDEIFGRTNIDIKRLYEVLFELQLRNEIICLAGNYYVKVERIV